MPTIRIKEQDIEVSQEEIDRLLEKHGKTGKRWKPEIGDIYWYIDSYGNRTVTNWEDGSFNNWHYAQRNCFKTEAEAEQHKKCLEAVAVLKDDAGDFEPDWGDGNQYKYYGYYDHNDKGLGCGGSYWSQGQGATYFPSEESVKASQTKHRAEWLVVLGVEG